MTLDEVSLCVWCGERPAVEGRFCAECLPEVIARAARAKQEDDTSPLAFHTVRELAALVAAAGPARYLLRGLWPAGDYGVHAAEPKGQKTWTTTAAAVAVASGRNFLDVVEVDDPGPVLMFCGEGGERNILRRLRADAERHGIAVEDLPITVCARAPHLADDAHLGAMGERIAALSPRLVTLDPLYLSARGGKLADLYSMGELLERPQRIAAGAGAALWVTTHYNRREGKGWRRILGAGPAEWGRVVIGAAVLSRHTHPTTKATDVLTELSAYGGEIPDRTLRVRRQVWADDPNDLDSPLHLDLDVTETDAEATTGDDLAPAAQKLREALEAIGPSTSERLVDWIAQRYGHGLRRETASRHLNDFERRGIASSNGGPFKSKTWELKAKAPRTIVTRV